MMKYLKAEAEIIEFDNSDVITASCPNCHQQYNENIPILGYLATWWHSEGLCLMNDTSNTELPGEGPSAMNVNDWSE